MKVAIIGLGLIGGSIGVALKKSNWRSAKVTGYVRRSKTGSTALRLGMIDQASSSLKQTVKGAELVIVATPVLTIKDIFREIAPHIASDSTVTDVASTKVKVMSWAEELLPSHVSFVGGHPMAGREISGIIAAQPDLFRNCTYCLTPGLHAKPRALQLVEDMVQSLGARPIIIDAEEHDDMVAGISHLPFLISAALVSATCQNPIWPKMSLLASSGYRDVTRLASGSPEVNAHICHTNQKPINAWIDDFIKEMQEIQSLLSADSNGIEKYLATAQKARQKWLEKR
ncbi:MAG: prephenate dehydrogenase/arogenate dehydrogenase family protein [Chloroflexi bacterium]|nr:prephenate dehydrogenase/arogenate dehydrogenase family protein [Chloroflexota bacterium]MBM3175166.1 prephenate dehydrogenase/arogenate dehydrogenase family protein [Chloroflexota bacterium]MBM4449938.1 prephenate dehydrogenase/arogenate dehydrogenase family protein [Chloroflexota bacterium]